MGEAIDAKETVEDSSSHTPMETDDGLVSTVEYQMSDDQPTEGTTDDGGDKDVGDDTGADTSDGAEQNTPDDPKPERYDQIPRFQELIAERNALKEQLAKAQQPQQDTPTTPTFQNILEMEDEAIVDEFSNNPKKFVQNLAQQMFYEFNEQLTAQQQQQVQQHQQVSQRQQMEQSLREFFGSRKDGQEMLKTGEIQRFIQEHPGHNAFSAYHELTREKAIKAEVEKAKKEERERVQKELKAKGHARSHAAGPTGNALSNRRAPELKNPDKFGGRNNVLLERMRKRQAGI